MQHNDNSFCKLLGFPFVWYCLGFWGGPGIHNLGEIASLHPCAQTWTFPWITKQHFIFLTFTQSQHTHQNICLLRVLIPEWHFLTHPRVKWRLLFYSWRVVFSIGLMIRIFFFFSDLVLFYQPSICSQNKQNICRPVSTFIQGKLMKSIPHLCYSSQKYQWVFSKESLRALCVLCWGNKKDMPWSTCFAVFHAPHLISRYSW